MTNKELQERLKMFPDYMEVLLGKNGCYYVEVDKPFKKYISDKKKDCIILWDVCIFPPKTNKNEEK